MREEERQLGSRDLSSSMLSVPTTAPEMNFSNCQFTQTELNKTIFDFLVTDGRLEIAEIFQQEAGLPKPPENSSLAHQSLRVSVREDIMSGRPESAIRQINNNHPELLDTEETLHFHLLQQQLIELIRQGDMVKAIRFAQEVVSRKSSSNDTKILQELEQTLALLAFSKPKDSPFGNLLEVSQKEKVAREANSAILIENGQKPQSHLETVLKLILWCEEQLEAKGIDHPKLDGLFKNL